MKRIEGPYQGVVGTIRSYLIVCGGDVAKVASYLRGLRRDNRIYSWDISNKLKGSDRVLVFMKKFSGLIYRFSYDREKMRSIEIDEIEAD